MAARARPPTTEPAMMPARAPEEMDELLLEEGTSVTRGSVVEVRVVAGRAEVTGERARGQCLVRGGEEILVARTGLGADDDDCERNASATHS